MNLSKIVEQEVTMNNQRMDRERDLILSGRPPTPAGKDLHLAGKRNFHVQDQEEVNTVAYHSQGT